MKAQTLSLENKLALLEAAIKALPDYTDQLKALEAAIKGMPDYSDKLAAIETAIKNIPDYSDKLAALETALEAIAENIEAQEGQYADELAALTESIDAIKSEVAAGNKSQDEALAEIIALLESGAIAGGGGGGSGGEGEGGEGEGSGGEGSGDEPTDPHISFTTEKPKGSTIQFTCAGEVKSISGAADLKKIGTDGIHNYPKFEATLTEQEVKVYGTFTVFYCENMNLTKINTDTQSSLEDISLRDNHDLVEFNFKFNAKLETLDLRGVDFTKEELEDLVKNKLPGSSDAYCFLDSGFDDVVVDNLKKDAAKKGWTLSFAK
jgi:tetratricopeptide (TPR) repeat protein